MKQPIINKNERKDVHMYRWERGESDDELTTEKDREDKKGECLYNIVQNDHTVRIVQKTEPRESRA